MGNAVGEICGRLAVGLRGLIPAPALVSAIPLVSQSCRLTCNWAQADRILAGL